MKFVLLKCKMVSYTRVTHGQIELVPVEFEDEQNDDLDSVEKMDDLDAPIVCGEGSQVLGDFDSAKGYSVRNYKKPHVRSRMRLKEQV